MPSRVEFMHQVGGLENLDRYFQRRTRNRQGLRIPEGLSAVFHLQSSLDRTPRARSNERSDTPTQVQQGFYYRISDTFMVYGGTHEQTYLAHHRNNDLIIDRLYNSARAVRNDYVHDTENEARHVDLCESNSFWNIYQLDYTAFISALSTKIICIGCGIGGTITNLTQGVTRI